MTPVSKLSPMMEQYIETKNKYKDCILFYRLGDFYEMFFDDALTASKVLEITLTGRDCGLEERAPMCGVPFHAAEAYINKLVSAGYKVAIAEQMIDPKLAKGLVPREVIRVVTPGTILSAQALDETKNNYIMSIVYTDRNFGVAVSDVSTGDFSMTEIGSESELMDEICKFNPAEIICNEPFLMANFDFETLKGRMQVAISALDVSYYEEHRCKTTLLTHFHVASLDALGLAGYDSGMIASGVLLLYLYETQKNHMEHITHIRPYATGGFMLLDTSTRRNLELCETLRDKQKRGTLLWVLDKTKTAMGARLLRRYIELPLLSAETIRKRQDAVEELVLNYIDREEIREYLNPIYDLERLLGRISYKTANPRDLLAFLQSLSTLPYIHDLLSQRSSALFKELSENFDDLQDLKDLVERAICEDPPISVREGGMIRDGFSEEVDTLRLSKTEGKDWLAELEAKEREATGIKNLRIKFNKVFGYYFEVTNSYLNMVPDYFIRKQTLTNGERFTTPKLKELENAILGAEDKLISLEYELFCQVRDHIASMVERIQTTAHAVAVTDVIASLATVAQQSNYIRPKINEKGLIDIKGGRHPVVEKMMSDKMFVENDVLLDNHNNRIAIITGPNMAGKSTYMRQVALITLMAQIGSFVPASSADIGICDRIFTRVGASDDLASGQSTFMVEMNEVSNILRNATRNSLIVLDEIGRGTSTYDGMSIAWAVVEYISDTKLLGAKTLFATHYHELTELEGALAGVTNYCIAVKEQGDDIVFLRKIIKGGADKSYGIQVAKLAGVPDAVIHRAKQLVEELTDNDIAVRAKEIAQAGLGIKEKKRIPKEDEVDSNQLTLFDTVKEDEIISEILGMDMDNMTPRDAFNALCNLQNRLKNRI